LIHLAARHPDWALGFADETWWSRVAQPNLHTFSPVDQPLKLTEQTVPKDDPAPKALACYGVLLRGQTAADNRVWLRFVDGRPVSDITIQFLAWGSTKLAAEGKTAWLLVWDNAPWHGSKAVRQWVHTHNQQVKASQKRGVRIVLCFLPSKSPWLNPIEPHWIHSKRRVLEAERLLTADEVAQRVCATFGCPRESHLTMSAKVT
jgi:transposase